MNINAEDIYKNDTFYRPSLKAHMSSVFRDTVLFYALSGGLTRQIVRSGDLTTPESIFHYLMVAIEGHSITIITINKL